VHALRLDDADRQETIKHQEKQKNSDKKIRKMKQKKCSKKIGKKR